MKKVLYKVLYKLSKLLYNLKIQRDVKRILLENCAEVYSNDRLIGPFPIWGAPDKSKSQGEI